MRRQPAATKVTLIFKSAKKTGRGNPQLSACGFPCLVFPPLVCDTAEARSYAVAAAGGVPSRPSRRMDAGNSIGSTVRKLHSHSLCHGQWPTAYVWPKGAIRSREARYTRPPPTPVVGYHARDDATIVRLSEPHKNGLGESCRKSIHSKYL